MTSYHKLAKNWCGGLYAALLGLLSVDAAHGQITTLASSFNGLPIAGLPENLVLDGNTFYGTTNGGYGSVFSVPVTGGTPTTLVSFNGTDGNEPWGGVTISGDTLYGTTHIGGAYSQGTLFSAPITGGAPTTLIDFNLTSSTGSLPYAGLTVSGSTLYGATSTGSPSTVGTFFSEPVTGGTPTILANELMLNASMILSGGILYGTTRGGVFSVPVSGSPFKGLGGFNGANGGTLVGSLTLSGNILYGTTESGGAYGYGTIFSVPITGGGITTLGSFNGANGQYPIGGVTVVGNMLYGTAQFGGANDDGTIFSEPLTGGTPTDVADFDFGNGYGPQSNLILIGNTLYGTTQSGGTAGGGGTLFSIVVPEPSTWVLLLGGLGLLAFWRGGQRA